MSKLQRNPVQLDPYNAEAPMPVLDAPLTPDGLFYVRSHFAVPDVDPDRWRLLVDLYPGRQAARQFTLADLRAMAQHTVTVTLECAGNGRTTLDPAPAGTPWAFGAVSTAAFTGTAVRNLLDGDLPSETAELLFLGADTGSIPTGETIRFGRSLTPDVALHPDTIVAWEMNGRPLPLEHGSPLRLVVPRWYGVASVKWLDEIRTLDAPYEGYFQTTQYLYNGQDGLPDGTAVTTMRVRSVIASPVSGQTVGMEPQVISGSAWSGDAPVARVEVSTDGGESWQTAVLDEPVSAYGSAVWRLNWTPAGVGDYELVARATDAHGNTQPLEQVWTEQGYGNNSVHRVRVSVRE